MFTTLVAVIVALVLGHLAPALMASLRSYHWYGQWLRWIDARALAGGPWRSHYGIVLAIVPLLLVVALLQWSLHGAWFGLPALMFGVLALAMSWGPRDLDRDVEAIINAEQPHQFHEALTQLQVTAGSVQHPRHSLVAATVINALRRWFAPLFWFLLLGPAGAVLYRLLALAGQGTLAATLPAGNASGARKALALMEWPVAQLMTFAMALVGNFDTVFRAWRDAEGGRWALSAAFLAASAKASVGAELGEEADEYRQAGIASAGERLPELRDAMSLVWRMLLLWMAVLALLIIAGWVR